MSKNPKHTLSPILWHYGLSHVAGLLHSAAIMLCINVVGVADIAEIYPGNNLYTPPPQNG